MSVQATATVVPCRERAAVEACRADAAIPAVDGGAPGDAEPRVHEPALEGSDGSGSSEPWRFGRAADVEEVHANEDDDEAGQKGDGGNAVGGV